MKGISLKKIRRNKRRTRRRRRRKHKGIKSKTLQTLEKLMMRALEANMIGRKAKRIRRRKH